jgi:hypothetical protein
MNRQHAEVTAQLTAKDLTVKRSIIFAAVIAATPTMANETTVRSGAWTIKTTSSSFGGDKTVIATVASGPTKLVGLRCIRGGQVSFAFAQAGNPFPFSASASAKLRVDENGIRDVAAFTLDRTLVQIASDEAILSQMVTGKKLAMLLTVGATTMEHAVSLNGAAKVVAAVRAACPNG